MKKLILISIFLLLILTELSFMYSEVSMRSGGKWEQVSPILLMALILFSVLFILMSKNRGTMPLWGKAFVLFDFYVIVISAYHGLFQHSYGFGYSSILICVQPLLLFYVMYYVQQDNKMDKLSNKLFLLMFTAFVISFGWSIITKREYNTELFVEDNNSYFLMYLLPGLSLVNAKSSKLKIYMIITFSMVFLSMKRGGIMGLTGGLITYYLLNNNIKNKNIEKSVRIGGVLFGGVVLAYFLNDIMGGLVMGRFEDMLDSGGSGRDLIWAEGILLISNSTDIEKLFGHGFDSARAVTELSVSLHNDYLEMIYDFGWIGLLLFAIFVILLVIFIIKNKKTIMAPAASMALAICLFTMIAAHIIIYTQYFILIALCLGGVCGEYAKRKKIQMRIS